MITDHRPSRGKLRREYDASYSQVKIRTPSSEILKPMFEMLTVAIDGEDATKLKQVCAQFLGAFSSFYGIPTPSLKLLGPRPHATLEGRLASELFGDYHIEQARIRLWTRTAIKKQWTSSKTVLSTLCHEFMHHLDVTHLRFAHSFHTLGFFERTHRLYLAAIGHPCYRLVWRQIGPPFVEDVRPIDWPEIIWAIDRPKTDQRKAKVSARAEFNK